MRRELKKIKAENAALAQRVQAGRENIARTQQQVSTTVNEWKVRKKTRTIKCRGAGRSTQQFLHFYSKKGQNINTVIVHNWSLISCCILELICFGDLKLKMHM